MMSATARARRRGAMTEEQFLAVMAERGFVPMTPQEGRLHEFSHPAVPGHTFFIAPLRGDTFSRALCRIATELEEATGPAPLNRREA